MVGGDGDGDGDEATEDDELADEADERVDNDEEDGDTKRFLFSPSMLTIEFNALFSLSSNLASSLQSSLISLIFEFTEAFSPWFIDANDNREGVGDGADDDDDDEHIADEADDADKACSFEEIEADDFDSLL
jgi:hypothetical protein